jgi:hypothetical protein
LLINSTDYKQGVFMCPACPPISFLGGLVGGYIGINAPSTFKGRCISVLATAMLVTANVVALKVLFGVPFCYGNGFTFNNIGVILSKTLVLGVIYSIGVNYLLKKYERNPVPIENIPSTSCPHCIPSNL